MIKTLLKKAYHSIIPFIYARTNYKLFLRKSFLNLDRRIQMLITATDYIPNIVKPIPISAPFGNRMLVVAPHQDDEIIGCGGAMLLQRNSGRAIRVIFVQDGGNEYKADGMTREELIQIREKEARTVANEMGIPVPVFLRYDLLNGPNGKLVAKDLAEALNEYTPDAVFVPFFLDYNWVHLQTNFALANALLKCGIKVKLFGYEVWGLCTPNVILNIDKVIEEKKRLLSLYKSQVSGTDYVHCITGLNMYHSRAFGARACKHAERFFEIPAQDYIKVVNHIHQIHHTKDG